MKRNVQSVMIASACTLLFSGVAVGAAEPPPAAAPAAQGDAGAGGVEMTGKMTGKVVTTMNAGGYTYVEVDDGTQKMWAAAPKFDVAVGDSVVVPSGMVMRNFPSKALGRTFDMVAFVSAIDVPSRKAAPAAPAAAHGGGSMGGGMGMPPAGGMGGGEAGSPHGGGTGATSAAAAGVDLTGIKKADGGQTVAELYAGKADLSGKDIKVRGRVVKFTPSVMGKNWLHLQDGTGAPGTNDITVSTEGTAAVGNLVLITGKLATDRDLGFGYHYELLVENADVKVE